MSSLFSLPTLQAECAENHLASNVVVFFDPCLTQEVIFGSNLTNRVSGKEDTTAKELPVGRDSSVTGTWP